MVTAPAAIARGYRGGMPGEFAVAFVMPAQAGIQTNRDSGAEAVWLPNSAAMTKPRSAPPAVQAILSA